MTGHRLDQLLAPRSIALVGASRTEGSIGNKAVRELRRGGFPGKIYPVNPRYETVEDLRCFPSLRALPEAVDLVIPMVATQRLEAMLAEAASCGARAAVIYDGAYLPDAVPPLTERLAGIARDAGMVVCGSNCTGFINLPARTRAFPWPPAHDLEPGHVALISHSGSTFGGLLRAERRLRFNLAVSPGHELTATVADYIDYALQMDSTRVIGLFIETARDPENFSAALKKAAWLDIPVVAIKVGRSAFSAELAQSHSGAIAGNDAAYRAVFERHGVHLAEDIDEMVATLQLFAQGRRVGRGGLAAIGDSGGERELVVDIADRVGVPFAQIGGSTQAELAAHLHPSLRAVNPLDAYAGPHDFAANFQACLAALLADPDSAMALIFSNVLSGFSGTECYIDICRALQPTTDKPIAVASLFAGTEHGDYAQRMAALGIPVIYGATPALKAVRHLLAHRDRIRAASAELPAPESAMVARWRARLAGGAALDEAEGLALLAEFGIPVQPWRIATDLGQAARAAAALGYPVALKTAMPGILHKSEVAGVRLGLPDEAALRDAYADLVGRLGPRVLVAGMAEPGIEMALGVIRDAQFGPLVMVAAGGVGIALFGDAQYALAPVDREMAGAMIERLAMHGLLQAHRGAAAADIEGLKEAVMRLSILASSLDGALDAVDVNPFIVSPRGGVAVDALVLPQRTEAAEHGPGETRQ